MPRPLLVYGRDSALCHNTMNLIISSCQWTMMLYSLLALLVCLCCVNGDCNYGKHSSVAAPSCQDIINIQPECYSKSGLFWLKDDSGSVFEAYCDMFHMGGGWTRVFSHFHNESTSCPTGSEGGLTWKEYTTAGGDVYCQRGSEGEGYAAYVDWNTDSAVTYSEVRGYIVMLYQRLSSSENKPDAFGGGGTQFTLEQEYMDGFTVQALTDPVRHVYSYVLGRSKDGGAQNCPKNGGDSPPHLLPPYEENAFACFIMDIEAGEDSEGFVDQVFYELEIDYFPESPPGSPWFEVSFGEMLSYPLRFRFVDSGNNDHGITIKDIEIFIR